MTLDSTLKCAGRAVLVALAAAALLLAIAVATPAHAQAEPTLTFTPETVTGPDGVAVRLTWSTQPAATSCEASGDPAWLGAKPPAGVEELPTVTDSRVYALTCRWLDDDVTLTWTPPSQNTNDSPFTDPADVQIHYGRSADALSESLRVGQPSPPLARYVVDGLAPGVWHFALTIIAQSGAHSPLSNTTSVTLTDDEVTRTVEVVFNRPKAATDVRAE